MTTRINSPSESKESSSISEIYSEQQKTDEVGDKTVPKVTTVFSGLLGSIVEWPSKIATWYWQGAGETQPQQAVAQPLANVTPASSIQPMEVEPSRRLITFDQVIQAYQFPPVVNQENLRKYATTEDYRRHAGTARAYYNAQQLSPTDALRVIYQREPTNICARHDYDTELCQETFGYETSVFYDESAIKESGQPFCQAPNTVCLYSETYMWNPPGSDAKKEVAIFSVPAPALDSPMQPHYEYYVRDGVLDQARYEEEMQFLFRTIEIAIRGNHEEAFQHRHFQRVIISRFGQGTFLSVLTEVERQNANRIFDTQYAIFKQKMENLRIPIFQSEFARSMAIDLEQGKVYGDIVQVAQEGDFIVNAWDPHSAPGNGNDMDRSFDGAIGKSSGVLLTQTAWLNPKLQTRGALTPVS